MESSSSSSVELLKMALANIRQPEVLNHHPWADLMHESNGKSPGLQLAELLTRTFRNTIPSGPPRAGKRLDTRWGIFGILAAQYFAPAILGTRTPSSLREAWESLDRSILLFAYGRTDDLSEDERSRYQFAADEIEPAPNSTLSDWHRRGIEQLAELVTYELERIREDKRVPTKARAIGKKVAPALVAIVLILGIFLGWKAWQIYQRAEAIKHKAAELESYLNPTPGLEQLPDIALKIGELRTDIELLADEVEPYIWITPHLGWLPKYGGDVSQAEQLISLAQNLVVAADDGLNAVSPAIEESLQKNEPLDMMALILQLQEASPQLLNAQVSIAQARETRDKINVEQLSPVLQSLIVERIDPLLQSIMGAVPMDDAITLVRIAPKLLGSGKTGPQTYLILIQNEDELRPTGGFLTAAGSAVVKDGKLISINIESSDLVDDLSKPYPVPPWQFQEFMNIEMLLFRDSNWFTDFPTTVSWSEYLYSYGQSTSADGVIAIDMQVILRLLKILGPVRIQDVGFAITSENVMTYMRSAEETRPEGVQGEWDRKQFIGRLAQPLLEKMLDARGQTWTRLVPVLMDLLDEHHILIQIDDEDGTRLLEQHGWDGAVRIPSNSDFLMVVDTNMGYNKSNAVLETELEYQVDLRDVTSPVSTLAVFQTNHSKVQLPCEPLSTLRFILRPAANPGEIIEPTYNMDECHWGYIRVYSPNSTKLISATPREIAAEATMLGEAVPARTDDLGSENIASAQVFGMMVLTPTQQSTTTKFEYALPPQILTKDEEHNTWTYRLKVQKQPGTVAQPFAFSLRLPANFRIKSATIPLSSNSGAWSAKLDLRRDVMLEVVFTLE